MEIKIFGKKLFEVRKSGGALFELANNQVRESKYLPDFYKKIGGNEVIRIEDYGVLQTGPVKIKSKKTKKEEKLVVKITPKGVYELKTLNDNNFKLNTDPKYVDSQIQDFKDKLDLLKKEEYDMRNGVDEVSSILVRFENRKKYPEVKELFEEYPYTTTAKIADLIKTHNHLKMGQIAQFVADLPKEAVETMKQYNKATDKLCGKQAVFYIIAEKKDFEKSNNRRDPILLAQSPFGHVWQILGAWDKEMLLVEEL